MISHRQGNLLTPEEIAADNARVAAKVLPEEPSPPPVTKKPPRTFRRLGELLPVVQTGKPVEPEPPVCPRCNGLGYIGYAVPYGDSRFGKMFPCDAPGCPGVQRHKEKRTVTFIERMTRHFGGKTEHYEHATIADLDRKELRHNPVAVDAARQFIAREPLILNGIDKYSLIFTGDPGTGKTYIASIIFNELQKRGELVWFNTVRTMLKAVQTGYSFDADMKDTAVEDALCNTPFLFIDELEINRASGDKIDILEAIINSRMLAKMPTVITTNLTQYNVGDVWNERIRSRLLHVAWWINMGNVVLRDKSGAIDGSGR